MRWYLFVKRSWIIILQACTKYNLEKDVLDHQHWVNVIIPIPTNCVTALPNGGFVSGSQNGEIRVFDLASNLITCLTGHTASVLFTFYFLSKTCVLQPGITFFLDQVSSLSFTSTGEVISGSWDGTARVWNVSTGTHTKFTPLKLYLSNVYARATWFLLSISSWQCAGACVSVMPDHENAVCVLGLPDGSIVTGSAGVQVPGLKLFNFMLALFFTDGSAPLGPRV